MSGHSKWSQIKRQKGVADVKRGHAFTKLGLAITIAVKAGGGITDPNQNFRLRLEIEKARMANMPKENITRAIERGVGKGDKGELSEVVYEGFAPHGISIIVEAVTDNKQRTTPEVKSLFDKNGGTLGVPGSVAYQFSQMGVIVAPKNGKSFDDLFLLAADHGVVDVEDSGEEVVLYTNPSDLAKIKESLKDILDISSAELIRKPNSPIVIADKEVAEKIIQFIERLENHDDVQKVYSNFDIA
ncbi:MAG: YebC/PmpR family DNA-binding transcriptional regulator [Candidatus Levybacteria bacterium]|nr:YebC/PmpR family DNA-binding transcriptional regulator [Candidatus Levybacteria bacterium]